MNVYTAEQANKFWCPHARCGNEAGCNRNSIDFPLEPTCIADFCMAWRWQPLMADASFLAAVKRCMDEKGLSHAKASAYVGDHRSEFGLPIEPYLGYCGLAGGPKP
jgi:hypothetical protein